MATSSNRTPTLMEHYGSGGGGGGRTLNGNNAASVPRPTIASEIKMLKEMSRGSPGAGPDILNSYQS
jgi:hypothetical protein